ncbi:MAG: hypothetical protein ACWA5A_03435 [Marinibacterium sp.]
MTMVVYRGGPIVDGQTLLEERAASVVGTSVAFLSGRSFPGVTRARRGDACLA